MLDEKNYSAETLEAAKQHCDSFDFGRSINMGDLRNAYLSGYDRRVYEGTKAINDYMEGRTGPVEIIPAALAIPLAKAPVPEETAIPISIKVRDTKKPGRPRVKCSACGMRGPGRLPKGGDGVTYFPQKHHERAEYDPYRPVWTRPACPGSNQPAILMSIK